MVSIRCCFGFSIVRALEAYVIFPFAVGRRLKINALVIIIMITAGGILWGAAGMILFIPFASIRETDCRSFASFKDIVYTTRRRREEINTNSKFSRFLYI
jgi:predicted PurR-regulated permease PerM